MCVSYMALNGNLILGIIMAQQIRAFQDFNDTIYIALLRI